MRRTGESPASCHERKGRGGGELWCYGGLAFPRFVDLIPDADVSGASSRVRGHLEVELFDWLKCFGFLFASQDAGQKRAQLQIESEGRRSAVTYSKTTLCAPDQCSLDGPRRRTPSPLHVSPPLLNGSNDVQ